MELEASRIELSVTAYHNSMDIITDDDIAIIEEVEVQFALKLSNRAKNEACLKILKMKRQTAFVETKVVVKLEPCQVEDYNTLTKDGKRRRLDEEINIFQRKAHEEVNAEGVKLFAAARKKADDECTDKLIEEHRKIDESVRRKRRLAYLMLDEEDNKLKETVPMIKEEPKEFVGVEEAKCDIPIMVDEEPKEVVPILVDDEAKEVSTMKRRSKRGASGNTKKLS